MCFINVKVFYSIYICLDKINQEPKFCQTFFYQNLIVFSVTFLIELVKNNILLFKHSFTLTVFCSNFCRIRVKKIHNWGRSLSSTLPNASELKGLKLTLAQDVRPGLWLTGSGYPPQEKKSGYKLINCLFWFHMIIFLEKIRCL